MKTKGWSTKGFWPKIGDWVWSWRSFWRNQRL